MSSIGRRAFARILLLASGVVFAGACGNDLPTTAARKAPETPRLAFATDPTAWYVIRSQGSGLVADVSQADCCNGAWIHQWQYAGLPNQQWRIVDVGGGYYKITARHSGKAMDVENASFSDAAKVHQWTYQGLSNQQWSINAGVSGWVITARHSGKALTVSGGGAIGNGALIRQYAFAGWLDQYWSIERVP
jgi:hypothetical protein